MSKKGVVTIWMAVGVVVAGAAAFTLMFFFLDTILRTEALGQADYLAKDITATMDAVYAAPGEVTVSYYNPIGADGWPKIGTLLIEPDSRKIGISPHTQDEMWVLISNKALTAWGVGAVIKGIYDIRGPASPVDEIYARKIFIFTGTDGTPTPLKIGDIELYDAVTGRGYGNGGGKYSGALLSSRSYGAPYRNALQNRFAFEAWVKNSDGRNFVLDSVAKGNAKDVDDLLRVYNQPDKFNKLIAKKCPTCNPKEVKSVLTLMKEEPVLYRQIRAEGGTGLATKALSDDDALQVGKSLSRKIHSGELVALKELDKRVPNKLVKSGTFIESRAAKNALANSAGKAIAEDPDNAVKPASRGALVLAGWETKYGSKLPKYLRPISGTIKAGRVMKASYHSTVSWSKSAVKWPFTKTGQGLKIAGSWVGQKSGLTAKLVASKAAGAALKSGMKKSLKDCADNLAVGIGKVFFRGPIKSAAQRFGGTAVVMLGLENAGPWGKGIGFIVFGFSWTLDVVFTVIPIIALVSEGHDASQDELDTVVWNSYAGGNLDMKVGPPNCEPGVEFSDVEIPKIGKYLKISPESTSTEIVQEVSGLTQIGSGSECLDTPHYFISEPGKPLGTKSAVALIAGPRLACAFWGAIPVYGLTKSMACASLYYTGVASLYFNVQGGVFNFFSKEFEDKFGVRPDIEISTTDEVINTILGANILDREKQYYMEFPLEIRFSKRCDESGRDCWMEIIKAEGG